MYRGKRKTHKFLVALNNVSQRKRETETEGEKKKKKSCRFPTEESQRQTKDNSITRLLNDSC